MDDMQFSQVHVANWGGLSDYYINRNGAPSGDKVAVTLLQDTLRKHDFWRDGFHVAVAVYTVPTAEVDEVTVKGPQVYLRGQPVECEGLTVVKT